MSLRERDVEGKVCKYARDHGFLTPKLNIVGERGWPDRIFISPTGEHIYVEFKAPGKKLEKIQEYREDILMDRGILVLTIDNVERGKDHVDELVAARLSEESD